MRHDPLAAHACGVEQSSESLLGQVGLEVGEVVHHDPTEYHKSESCQPFKPVPRSRLKTKTITFPTLENQLMSVVSPPSFASVG